MRLKIAGFKIHASIVLGVLSLASLAAYASLRSAVLGAAAFVLLVGAVAADLFFGGDAPLGARGTGGRRTGARGGKRGKSEWRKPVFEIGATLAVAVAAWLALCFALQTSTPLNVVTSCSMLPALERGDFIILQGGGVKAREAAVPFPLGGAETKPVVLDARQQGKRYYFAYSTFLPAGAGAGAAQSSFANYSFADCARVPLGGGEAGELEAGGLEACASGVEVNGVFFPARNDNDVIVYEAQPAQYGLVIHRVLARLRAPDGVFYLTKGDNNQFADQQLGISVVPESAVKGRVIGRIPLVGYFKLLLFLQFDFPQGCDATLRYLN